MRYSVAGPDLKLSVLGMGCWAFGGGAYWGDVSQRDTDAVVSAALDEGINYFDTAEVYNDGNSEIALGIALRARRHEAIIGTKFSTSNAAPDILRRRCEDSLKRLGTDYIDIYMLHWPLNRTSVAHFMQGKDTNIHLPAVAEVFGALCDLRREGKIRKIGISNHGTEQMGEVLRYADISVNQLPYNLLCRAIEPEILPFCKKNGIVVIGYMAFMQGILTGRYKSIKEIPPPQAHSRHFRQERGGAFSRHLEEGAEEETERLLESLFRLSEESCVSPAVIALAWTLRNKTVACSLAGSSNISDLRENIKAARYRLSDDMVSELDKLSVPVWNKLGDSADYYENRKNSRIK